MDSIPVGPTHSAYVRMRQTETSIQFIYIQRERGRVENREINFRFYSRRPGTN